jgi:chorismate mutase/prephenate dehydratase
VIGRLPFWGPRPDGAPDGRALVVAATAVDASGDDQSLVGFECDTDISRARLSGELSRAGLEPQNMVLVHQPGSSIGNVLAEVAGYVADDDVRLGRLGKVIRRPIVLGAYAVPLAGGPLAGGPLAGGPLAGGPTAGSGPNADGGPMPGGGR